MEPTTWTTPTDRAASRLAAIVIAASVLAPGGAASAETGADPGRGAAAQPDLATIAARWSGYAGRSKALDCLGARTARRAGEVVAVAVRRGAAAARAEHVDARAAAHSAARTALVGFVRSSTAPLQCRLRSETSVQVAYRAAAEALPDRPAVWRGGAVGNSAGRRADAGDLGR